jgi:hypothetical protein
MRTGVYWVMTDSQRPAGQLLTANHSQERGVWTPLRRAGPGGGPSGHLLPTGLGFVGQGPGEPPYEERRRRQRPDSPGCRRAARQRVGIQGFQVRQPDGHRHRRAMRFPPPRMDSKPEEFQATGKSDSRILNADSRQVVRQRTGPVMWDGRHQVDDSRRRRPSRARQMETNSSSPTTRPKPHRLIW